MTQQPPPPSTPPSDPQFAPRCLRCGYILTGLEAGRCPECGLPFDSRNPATYTTRPLFNRWRFWLPGFLLAFAVGAILYPIVIQYAGFRWTVAIVLPLCLGTLIGFSCRVSRFFQVLLALILLAGLLLGLYMMSMVGVYCGLILGAVALTPLMFGTLLGVILRTILKDSAWEQRWHLPTLLLLLIPMIAGALEARFEQPYPDEVVRTEIVLPVSPMRAWASLMLYEEVHGTPPFLMRFALPRPLYTMGSMESVGDLKVCVYSKGRLVKRVTQRVPQRILAFDVVEQTKIENRSVILKSGSFEFDSDGAGGSTRITLTTRYQPLLGPRWVWRWSEEIGIHTLHEYVLKGMRLRAEAEMRSDAGRRAQIAGGGGS